MIETIKISDFQFELSDYNDYIGDLNKINIFTGLNNSGKSRFLRNLFVGGENTKCLFIDASVFLDSIFSTIMKEYKVLLNDMEKKTYFFKHQREINDSLKKAYIADNSTGKLDLLLKLISRFQSIKEEDFVQDNSGRIYELCR